LEALLYGGRRTTTGLALKKKKDHKIFSYKAFYKTPKGVVLVLVFLLLAGFFSSFELAREHYPDGTCVICHEMKEPVRKWRDAGVADSHPDCIDCHFDRGMAGVWQMSKSAVIFVKEHFRRNQDEPLKAAPEPFFVDINREPGYYSYVPNHRCSQCKQATNHKTIDLQMVHRQLIRDVSIQPCKDCHNHQMRYGQKFYQKILPD
jgi:trimethylamine-N-oxide reductase (cytochrome c) cytochrome c-type subunit TorY